MEFIVVGTTFSSLLNGPGRLLGPLCVVFVGLSDRVLGGTGFSSIFGRDGGELKRPMSRDCCFVAGLGNGRRLLAEPEGSDAEG